jgi:hypothetical protein
MKNIKELRSELSKVFMGLKDGSVSAAVATELNNTAGKMINSVKVELEYASLCKVKPNIAFLE